MPYFFTLLKSFFKTDASYNKTTDSVSNNNGARVLDSLYF
jgi:hypothetical protein